MIKRLLWFIYIHNYYGYLFQLRKSIKTYIHKIKLLEYGSNISIHPSVEIRDHCNISIGDGVSINHGSELYGGGGIVIGEGTMISYYVTILSDSRTFMGAEPLKSAKRKGERIKKKTIIGKDVWIGTKAVIMPGVHIKNHAVVAAGAVITKDVEEWDIVGGNPARKINNRLNG